MTHSVIPSSPSGSDYEALEAQVQKASEEMFNADDPIVLFEDWLREAGKGEGTDPNAMSLATVDRSGLPNVRIVLLKAFDARGFVFYTNAKSTKGRELEQTPKAALCFHWKSLERSVRIRGAVEIVSLEESDLYFSQRSRGSQIGAWASQQSTELDRRQLLIDEVEAVNARYAQEDVPRPPHWHGWRVIPQVIEFWHSRPYRLHDRLVFSRKDVDAQNWNKTRLYP